MPPSSPPLFNISETQPNNNPSSLQTMNLSTMASQPLPSSPPLNASTSQPEHTLDLQAMNPSTILPPRPAPPKLPVEAILNIIDQLVTTSTGEAVPVALPASHPITKALYSFAIACKATSSRAIQHLYTYCLYIDSLTRLDSLALALDLHETNEALLPPNILSFATQLYLDLGREDDHLNYKQIANIWTLIRNLVPNLTNLVTEVPIFDNWSDLEDIDGVLCEGIVNAFSDLKSLQHLTLISNDNLLFHSSWSQYALKTLVVGDLDLEDYSIWTSLGSMKKLEVLIIHTPRKFYNSIDISWARVNGSSNTLFTIPHDPSKPIDSGRHLTVVFASCNRNIASGGSYAHSSMLTMRHVHCPNALPYSTRYSARTSEKEASSDRQHRKWLKSEMVKAEPLEKWIKTHEWKPDSPIVIDLTGDSD